MADPYHHAKSSVKKWGGVVEDYLPIHQWFDGTKQIMCDFRHRALRHHAEGIATCVELFGPVITISTGREVPTRWIGEQHVQEDFGWIPSALDFLRCIQPQPWMMKPQKLPKEVTDGA
jgi:hypothetical protein